MNVQQFWNGVRWSAAKSALGGNTEVCHKLLCCLDALKRSFNAIGEMHQSQVEFCFGMKLQVAQWRKVSSIRAIPWDRHVNPVDWSRHAGSDGVGYLDQLASVLRLFEMFVSRITITEVIAHLGWNVDSIAEPHEPLEDFRLAIRQEGGHNPFQDRELYRCIPLDSQFVLRNARGNT